MNPPAPSSRTRFAFGSCQYPAGIFDRPMAGVSFNRLDKALERLPDQRIEAVLLLGDQIYADASYGIIDPASTLDRYHQAHKAWMQAAEGRANVRHFITHKRMHLSLDDHEIKDNWEPCPHPENQQILQDARRAFDDGPGSRMELKRSGEGAYFGPVSVGNAHQVFMLDTRTTRDPRPWGPGAGRNTAHIVSEDQRKDLEAWLLARQAEDGTGPVTPKFISSQVWLLPRHAGRFRLGPQGPGGVHTRSDSWDGYPESLYWLLGFIARHGIQGVVVLCGDAHLAGRTRVSLYWEERCTDLLILQSPALYAPFPFANAQPHHYRRHDRFSWMSAGDRFNCEVSSELQDLGDGFVQVEVALTESKKWQVMPMFDTENPSAGVLCAPWVLA